ncbi:PKD domain-containing protein [Candidatus Peregrinibacteria bacterium]|nr:PKD domain-containing protein [Candidatus Peregrinibacteria bacterium]MBT7736282.1 PKD domain-containing protein [Candidatus Peregrinibacteria bacterium]
MKNIKKLLAFAIIAALAATIVGTAVLSASTANAFSADFSTSSGGQSFTDYKPGEDLTLGKDGLSASLATTDDATEFILRVVNFALGFLGLIAVVIVIYGGVLYVTAAGEEERTQTGKKAIQYAAIGLLIVLGSFAFVNTIIRGAAGEENGSGSTIGANTGGSFNAAATEVRSLAKDIYTNFVFFAEVNEETKTMLNDLNKSSLSYKSKLVSKSDMLSYLYTAKEKLYSIRSRLIKFSEGYGRINTVVSYIDFSIDLIQSKTRNMKVKINGDGTIRACLPWELYEAEEGIDVAAEAASWNDYPLLTELPAQQIAFFSTALPMICSNSFSNYPAEIYFIWATEQEGIRLQMQDATPENEKSLHYIIKPIRDDFEDKLMDSLWKLTEIKQQLSGIEAVQIGDIGSLYKEMMDAYGYDFDKISDNKSSHASFSADSGFLNELNGWESVKSPSEINTAGEKLVEALELQLEFADALAKLETVIARLRANTTTGNAPLVVNFDVNESIDPAGGSIAGGNIEWKNISGEYTFEGDEITVGDSDSNDTVKSLGIGDSVVCTPLPMEGESNPAPTFRQCTFNYPGTYIATVTINSNNPAKYVAGTSSLIVKVNPPNTKINLDITAGGSSGKTIQVMKYYESGILQIDRNYIQVTTDDAIDKKLVFNAGATENVKIYKWDMGDGTIKEGPTDGTFAHSYKSKGKYTVQLEVMNKLDQIDRKIFTVDVKDTAAYITLTPGADIAVGDNVTIDGSLSSSSGGTIRAYEWKIEKKIGDDKYEDVSIGQNANKPTFIHAFDDDGHYKILLTIVSSDPEPATAEYEFDVKSQFPVALLNYEIPDSGQPAIVHLDGSSSFDPDGDDDDLAFEWTIKPDGDENWTIKEGKNLDQADPIIEFLKKGEYEIKLKAIDSSGNGEEYGQETQTIVINNLLDISWGEFDSTGFLGTGDNEAGEAKISFKIDTKNGVDYVIDFGDGEESSGPITGNVTVPHVYTATGKYTVEATVYDDSDNDNTIVKNIYIGGGSDPLAKSLIFVNGTEVYDLTKPIEVSKKDVITFDASESRNIDGTGRNLKYSWDFGDTNKSSSKAATHSYDELSPLDPGYFTVSLEVYDKDEPAKAGKDEVYIKVVNKAPTFSAIQAVPTTENSDLITPVNVDVKAHGADDADGSIIQYRWWYFDVDDPDEQLGVQITKGSSARLVIGTTGKEGKKVTYGFGLEVTDSENKTVSSYDILAEAQVPTIQVENGPNELPEAKFNVDTTTVFAGDAVRFTSASSDPDGTLVEYIWDVEGDGFHNNEPTDQSTLDFTYTIRDLEGYDVRLKVRDDKGGEDISEPITIYVDSLAEEPTAAFSYTVIEGSAGKKLRFSNNSEADDSAGAEIISYIWDFDTDSNLDSADTNGDGDATNDADSQAFEPERLYTEYGTYTIKLTVTDNQGNQDEVERTVQIPLADPPVAAFTYQVINGEVIFQNNSTADTESGAEIDEYIWDFDTASKLTTADSDGDGVKDNDTDSDLPEPTKKYSTPGIYKVKLTVVDSNGSEDSVVNVVDATGEGTSGGTSPDLQAALTTDPLPSNDGAVSLSGSEGSVKFDFTMSEGAISYYVIDKNIYFDTDGNGIKNDDQDFKSTFPGTWKTNFEKVWGKTVVKLTVIDIYENESSVTQEIKF